MTNPTVVSTHSPCVAGCKAAVPSELESVGLCVLHFTQSVEQACAEMHREIALRGASIEREAEVAAYIAEHSLLMARVSSALRMTDALKQRILSTFLSLMNLRESLDRAASRRFPELQPQRPLPLVAPALATVVGWH